MDVAAKKVLVSVAKWVGFWAVYAIIDLFVIDRYFDTTLFSAVVDNYAYRFMAITIILAYLSGLIEARFMHYKYSVPKPEKHNPHIGFTIIRFVSSVPMLSMVDWKEYLCYLAVFPFVHDGAYYMRRHELNWIVYSKKWFSKPDKSEDMAWSDIVLRYPIVRIGLALTGIICLILIQVTK